MVLGVDDAEVDPGITDQPVAVSSFGDADALAGQVSLMKTDRPPHLISPLGRTRRTA